MTGLELLAFHLPLTCLFSDPLHCNALLLILLQSPDKSIRERVAMGLGEWGVVDAIGTCFTPDTHQLNPGYLHSYKFLTSYCYHRSPMTESSVGNLNAPPPTASQQNWVHNVSGSYVDST